MIAAMEASEEQDLLSRLEATVQIQMEEIARLRAANEGLRAEVDAHGVLKEIYRNADLPETTRLKAASAALPVEKPKLLSVISGGPDRGERWRQFARFELKKQILTETGRLPAPGWDAHLADGVYQAPEGDDMPPIDLYGADKIKAFVEISQLIQRVPATESQPLSDELARKRAYHDKLAVQIEAQRDANGHFPQTMHYPEHSSDD
jgi:hypothetical protein